MTTKEMIDKAREEGFTIKTISKITDINLSTLYNYNCGRNNLSKEKEEKIRYAISILLNL